MSLLNFTFYRGTLTSHLDYLTDFHAGLLGHRLFVTFALALCFLGIWLRNLGGKILSLTSLLVILILYLRWYYEKFKWIEVSGINEDTVEYSRRLGEIGWFRGSNEWDFVLLFSALALMFWVVFRYKTYRSEVFQ